MVYFANILGFIAIILYICSYQMKKRREIIICNAASRVFYVLQYIVLGAFAGAVLDFTSIFISVILTKKDEGNKKLKMVILTLLCSVIVVSSIIFYKNIISLFPFVGVSLELLAMFFKKEKTIRIMSFSSQPFWIIYNGYYLAWSSVCGNVMATASIILALLRYDIRKKEETEISLEV